MSQPPSPKPRRDWLLTWVVIGSVVALLLCGGVVTAAYLVYQRGGEVVPVAAEKDDLPAAQTATACTDAKDLRAKLVPAAGPESAAPTAATDNDLVVTLHAGFFGTSEQVARDALTSNEFVCGAARVWSVAGDATADVQLLQFATKDDALTFYIARVLPFKQSVVAQDLAYPSGIDEALVVTRKGADGRIHTMGFAPKGSTLVVAEIYGKKRPDPVAVGDLLRQQFEKA